MFQKCPTNINTNSGKSNKSLRNRNFFLKNYCTMEEIPLINRKIKAGLESLRISQRDIANDLQANPSDISEQINGNRIRFSHEFLSSLLRHGLSLDALYDNKVSVEAYRIICLTKKKPTYDDCPNCQAKDREIKLLTENISIQKTLIDTLRKEKRV